MSDHEVLDFNDLKLIEIPVKIDGKEYRLREATGKAAVTYRNRLLAEISKREKGEADASHGLADLEPLLVSMCLVDSDSKFVPLAKILQWPARIQTKLYERARQISGMDDSGDETAKN